jgi:hypothetical protein
LPDEEIPVPGSDDRILLAARTTTSDGSGNLFRLRPDGSEVWRLAAPEGVGDSWTAVRIEGDAVVANSWSCYLVSIDLTSGEERRRIFTK